MAVNAQVVCGDPGRTGSLPSYSASPQPLLNRPYPTGSFPALLRKVSHDVCRNTSWVQRNYSWSGITWATR